MSTEISKLEQQVIDLKRQLDTVRELRVLDDALIRERNRYKNALLTIRDSAQGQAQCKQEARLALQP